MKGYTPDCDPSSSGRGSGCSDGAYRDEAGFVNPDEEGYALDDHQLSMPAGLGDAIRGYTESHEWAEKTGETFRVGISRYAQGELGEIVHVELPPIGATVSAGEEAVVLESTKAASDVYSPLSGKIIAVNSKVKENPTLLNASPEEGGWLFELAPSNSQEWDDLLRDEEYAEIVSPQGVG